jgi:hypothetical protein
MLPHDHGVEIPPKSPKSRYANRDFLVQGGGARHKKYEIGFYGNTLLSVYHRLVVQMRFAMLKLDFRVHLHPPKLSFNINIGKFKTSMLKLKFEGEDQL